MIALCWLPTAFSFIAFVYGDISCYYPSDSVLAALSLEDGDETLSLLQRQAFQFTGGQQSCGECSGHGSCAGSACTCETFWAGSDCSFFLFNQEDSQPTDSPTLLAVDDCQGVLCGDGSCVAGTCHCPVGQFGPSCADSQCPHDCFGHGSCNSGACTCQPGWVGTDCGLEESALYSRLEVLAQNADDYATVTESLASNIAQRLANVDRAKAEQAAALEATLAEQAAALEATVAAADAKVVAEKAAEEARVAEEVRALEDKAAEDKAAEEAQAEEANAAKEVRAAEEAKVLAAWNHSLEVLRDAKTPQQGCSFGCSGHGECDTVAHNCTCESGWAGDFCDQPRCEQDCSDRGFCVDGKCLCKEAFYGSICQHIRCPSDCSGNGYCFQGTCQCSGVWGGTTCSERLHSTGVVRMALPKQPSLLGVPDPVHSTLRASAEVSSCPESCSGRGSCVHGACSCQPGFYGISCAKTSRCNGHGSFVSAETCQCDDGWGGSDCSVELTCADVFCGGQGSCVTGKCVCSPGFGGPMCRLVLKVRQPASPKKDFIKLLQQRAAQDRTAASSLLSSPMTASWIPMDEEADSRAALLGLRSSSAETTSDLAHPPGSSADLADMPGLSEANDHLAGERPLRQRLFETLRASASRSRDSNTE